MTGTNFILIEDFVGPGDYPAELAATTGRPASHV